VWDIVRKIDGKFKLSAIKYLTAANSQITEIKDIANTLARTFSVTSTDQSYSPQFLAIKTQREQHPLNFCSHNTEYYNLPFSKLELISALAATRDSSPGPDNIHYQMIKHLPECSLDLLLIVFNRIWENSTLPNTWKTSTVIPIPKPGKDHSDPNNYRPISLTSCICKLCERMINNRLVYYLERNKILSDVQSGFRKQRSTNDHLIRLETWIREGFISGEHVVVVFFDLAKAYDTTWRYGILSDLFEAGLRGRLPLFIKSFMENRSFKVRLNSTFSDSFSQDTGVPQGSILSTTLFGLKINSIVKCLSSNTDSSLYVDDFLACYRAKQMRTIERQVQLSLNKLQTWADQNGFKFSSTKTVCIHFCNKHKVHPDPHLTPYGNVIPVVKETKFLGVLYDSKLTFLPHLKQLKTKRMKAMNLIKVVAHRDWGADRDTLSKLYHCMIHSKVDYGCIVYDC